MTKEEARELLMIGEGSNLLSPDQVERILRLAERGGLFARDKRNKGKEGTPGSPGGGEVKGNRNTKTKKVKK